MLAKIPSEYDNLFKLIRVYEEHERDLKNHIRTASMPFLNKKKADPEYEQALRTVISEDIIRIGNYIIDHIPELFLWLGYGRYEVPNIEHLKKGWVK